MFFFLIIGSEVTPASDSFSYSGRLVNADGSPVTGAVELKAELAYTNDPTVILCSQDFTGIGLTNGVFHLKLDLDCSPKTITQILSETPATHSVAIRITDLTHTKVYSFQALHSMPYSNISKQLVSMGATDGQILTWDSGEWKPLAPAAVESGSIGTSELADGSVTDPKVASGISRSKLAVGNPGYVLMNDGSGYVSETPYLSIAQGGTGATTVDGVFTSLGLGTAAKADLGLATGNALAFDDLKFCLDTEKLMLTAAPTMQWICAPENSPEDSTKLPLAGGTMSGTIDMNSNRIVGLVTPVDPNEAASKDYVDTLNESKWKTSGSNIYFDGGNVGIATSTPGEKLDVLGNIALSGKVRLKSDTANYVELKAPLSLGATLTFNLPNAYGTSGYALITDGAGNLSWGELANTSTSVGGDLTGTISNAQLASGVVGSTEIADLAVTDIDIANTTISYGKLNLADGDIPQAKVNGLESALTGKEPAIATGSTSQYWRGDKSWQTLDTAAVTESTNLYFTEDRTRGTDLAGFATTTGAVTATDTVLSALGKLTGNQANYVLKAGDTMSGALNMGTNKITSLADPTLASDAVNKNYVDSRASKWTLNGSNIYYSGGNVGIGTATPSSKLEVSAADTHTQVTIENTSSSADKYPGVKIVNYAGTGWGQPILSFGNIGGSASSPSPTGSDRSLASIIGSGFDGTNFPQAARIEFVTEDVFSGPTSPANIRFSTTSHGQTSYTEKMRISADGKVGIGESNPEHSLSVSGSTRIGTVLPLAENWGSQSSLQAASPLVDYGFLESPWIHTRFIEADQRGTAASGIALGGLNGFTNDDEVAVVTAGANRLHVNVNGDIGVGTNAPAAKLDVAGETRTQSMGGAAFGGANGVKFDFGTAYFTGITATTPTVCKKISFNTTYSTRPKVTATVNHSTINTVEGTVHDPMGVWLEEVTATYFEACVRDFNDSGLDHVDVDIDWIAIGI
jgi:hypothetical protein